MPVPRSPLAIITLTLAVGAGLWLGIRLVFGDAERAAAPLRPDIAIEHAGVQDLVRHGWKLTGKEPASWRDISVRLIQDDAGSLLAMRCVIDAAEASALTSFPTASVRPADGLPPADWPRDGFGPQPERFRLPAWWRPQPAQARHFLAGGPGLRIGLYLGFDPATGILHLWQWERRDAALPDLVPPADADDLADGLERFLRQSARPATPDGWLIADDLAGPGLTAACPQLPAGAAAACALYPWRGKHRYLVAVRGIGADAAWALAGGARPLRPLAAGAAPVAAWDFALPPGGAPPWFAPPAAADARAHCLLRIGPGTVEAGRWAAWADGALWLWDWEEPTPRPVAADIAGGSAR